MGNTTYRFIIILFDVLLTLMVVINFFGWSSVLVNGGIPFEIVGNWGRVTVDGEIRVYYFGFQSILLYLNALNGVVNNESISAFN